jgi:hemoglobin
VASILEQIGGKPAVAATVDGLYERLLADPSLAPQFAGVDMECLKRHMRAFLAVPLGGADLYGGRDMHAGLGVTNQAFVHLVATLASLGVPGETIGAIGAKLGPLRAQIVTASEEREAAWRSLEPLRPTVSRTRVRMRTGRRELHSGRLRPHGVAVSTRGFHPRSGSSTLPGGTPLACPPHGPPGTRTQNHGINLPHRLSPASGDEAPALRSGPSLHPRPDRAGGRRMASEGSPAEAGLPADCPIPGGFHRDGYSGALRGFQQIAADELAISRLALLVC